MKKIFAIFVFLYLFCAVSVFSEEVEIDSEIINVSPEREFFIIRAGEDLGIEMGDGIIVHRGRKKIADAYIIEVRRNVSAAEIISIESGYEIKEGDSTLIVKEMGGLQVEPEIAPEISEPKPQPTPVLKTTPAASVSLITTTTPGVIGIAIDADARTVFAYAILVLKEDGYSIASSNRAAGILLATKPIALSLMKELWADATAAIDHKLVASFDIKSEGNSSRLKVSAFKEHSRKERHIKRAVAKNSKHYNELLTVISKIKERAEH